MSSKPDFNQYSGRALMDVYNFYVDKWRTVPFKSDETGRKECEKAYAKWAKKNRVAEVTEESNMEDVAVVELEREIDETAAPAEAAAPDPAPRKRKPRAPKGKVEQEPHGKKIVVVAPTCPCKAGSKGEEHFLACYKSETVEEYLSHFENKSNARVWLSNFVKSGAIKVC